MYRPVLCDKLLFETGGQEVALYDLITNPLLKGLDLLLLSFNGLVLLSQLLLDIAHTIVDVVYVCIQLHNLLVYRVLNVLSQLLEIDRVGHQGLHQ